MNKDKVQERPVIPFSFLLTECSLPGRKKQNIHKSANSNMQNQVSVTVCPTSIKSRIHCLHFQKAKENTLNKCNLCGDRDSNTVISVLSHFNISWAPWVDHFSHIIPLWHLKNVATPVRILFYSQTILSLPPTRPSSGQPWVTHSETDRLRRHGQPQELDCWSFRSEVSLYNLWFFSHTARCFLYCLS